MTLAPPLNPLLPVCASVDCYGQRGLISAGGDWFCPGCVVEVELLTECPHESVIDLGTGWGQCDACDDNTFPISDEAAGMQPCGCYAEHVAGCVHHRPSWAEMTYAERWAKCGLPLWEDD